MREYPKIQTLFKRNPENPRYVVSGMFSRPEFLHLRDLRWVFTEKVDGTNTRVIRESPGKPLKFAGRREKSQLPVDLQEKLDGLFNAEKFDQVFESKSVCLYGEGYGKGIQKAGALYLPTGVDFVLFDVTVDGRWLSFDGVRDVAMKLGIRAVPAIEIGTLWDMVSLVEGGFDSRWGNFLAEGIVAKPAVVLLDAKGDPIYTKLKFRDFHKE